MSATDVGAEEAESESDATKVDATKVDATKVDATKVDATEGRPRERVPWHTLPELVLVKLFGYLGPRERLSAGRMCRRWYSALQAAPLWRSVRVVLCARGEGRGVRGGCWDARGAAVVLASPRFAPLVRRLELRWARPVPGLYHRRPRGTAMTSTPATVGATHTLTLHLLEALRASALAGHLQLQHLLLHDLVFSYKCCSNASQRVQLLAALAAFVGSQTRLGALSLENACLGVSEALRLLCAAARCSDNALTALRLRAVFREWQAPHASPRFSRALRRLSPLAKLCLDYPALSDATLGLLGECCGSTLRLLTVTVRDTDNRQHALSQQAWAQVAAACPHLRAILNIENLAHYDDICGLLVPSVPLYGIRLYSGRVWDQSRSRAFRSTLRLITTHYHRSLEMVQLNLKNSREQLDDVILELLSRCSRLSYFHFDGVLRRMDTVKDICRMHLDTAMNFQTIHVRPKIVNNFISSSAKDIRSTFQGSLAEKTIDFQIDIPTR